MILDLKFFLSLFLRRIHYFLIIAIAVAGVGATIAYTLPPVYEAEARLLVESPQIPGNLASSTVQASSSEILQIIRQRLLTRANLLDISREFSVHAGKPNISPDAIVADMRNRITMNLPGKRSGAAFFTIGFEADNGPLSARVVNELVTRTLSENASMRKATSGGTLQFFELTVDQLNQQLGDQSQRILDFQLANKEALPDSLNYRRTRQAALQERLTRIERDLVSLSDRRDRLRDIYERTGQVSTVEENLSANERKLKELQDSLANALTIYSEQNPRITTLKRQVELLQERVAQENATSVGDLAELSPFQIQMADIEGQIAFQSEQKTEVETELAELIQSIEDTPANAVILGTLQRDYQNLQSQFNNATADLAAAKTGDQIEAQSRGRRITVIEQAVAPRQPTSPNRKKITTMGIAGGIILGAAFVALLELLNSSVRRPADLSNKLGITPFITIPYIRTKEQMLVRRVMILGALLAVAIGIPTILYTIHTTYMPMDLFVDKVMDKLGLSDLIAQLNLKL